MNVAMVRLTDTTLSYLVLWRSLNFSRSSISSAALSASNLRSEQERETRCTLK